MKSVVFAGLAGLVGAGCTASAKEVQPPVDQIYFPTGLAVTPDQSVLFAANANSELRYDSGSITVFDLDMVDRLAADWVTSKTIPSGCAQERDHTETLACDEALSGLIRTDAGVRIGNFATEIALQDIGNGALRLIVPTRGEPSIAWLDWDGARLSCTTGTEGYALCDDAHRLSYVHNNPDLSSVPDEPFGVFADSAGQFAIVTHLTTGAVTLIDSPSVPTADRPVEVADVLIGLFGPDQQTGLTGTTGVAGRTPGAAGDIVYVGSRSEGRIQTLTVGQPVNNAPPYLLPGPYFFLTGVGSHAGNSNDTRGMAFSANGERLYLINRRPATLQIIDTSLGPTGAPRNQGVAAATICREGSTLTVADAGEGERAYVTCFQDGQIYVVDPRGNSEVEEIITVGRGPYSVVASPSRKKLYVSNFLEDTIAVIDTAPGATQNRVVLRIGQPKAP